MLTKDFITAGRAVFTVKSGLTGEHVTYRIKHKEGNGQYPPAWFVSVLTGPDNTKDYTFLGLLSTESGNVRLTRSTKFTDDSKPVRVIRWALRRVWNDLPLPDGYTIHHEGRCGKCGRVLTVPESCSIGIGPECIKSLSDNRLQPLG